MVEFGALDYEAHVKITGRLPHLNKYEEVISIGKNSHSPDVYDLLEFDSKKGYRFIQFFGKNGKIISEIGQRPNGAVI